MYGNIPSELIHRMGVSTGRKMAWHCLHQLAAKVYIMKTQVLLKDIVKGMWETATSTSLLIGEIVRVQACHWPSDAKRQHSEYLESTLLCSPEEYTYDMMMGIHCVESCELCEFQSVVMAPLLTYYSFVCGFYHIEWTQSSLHLPEPVAESPFYHSPVETLVFVVYGVEILDGQMHSWLYSASVQHIQDHPVSMATQRE